MKTQDGYESGTLTDFYVDKDGQITGNFSNGLGKLLGTVGMAYFSNPQGLEKGDNGVLKETSNSGPPLVGPPNSDSRGSINSGALELSNVDLSAEFTNMIIAQRAFQANSRVITTMDQVMEEVANLKR
jgi:flagellar hook protein FlgE